MAVLLFAWYCRQNNIHNDRRQAFQCPPSVCYGASTVGRAADCSGHVRVHVGRITIRTTCATVATVVVAVAIGESRIVTLCRLAAATSAGAAATRIAIVQTHNRFSFPPPSFWTATKFTETESACVVPALHQSSTERSRTSSASGRSSMSVQNVPSIKYVCVRQF